MEPKSRPRLDGVFPEMNTDKDEDAPLSPVRKQIQRFEKNAGKGPAPLPQGGFHLPKIGNYKPKSLMTSEPCAPKQNDNSRLSTEYSFEPIEFVLHEKNDPPPQPKSFILMGDNQQLMTIHTGESEGHNGEDSGIATPDKPAFTENPLFDKDHPESPLLEKYKDDESGIYHQLLDNAGFVDNPPIDDIPQFNDVEEIDDVPPADYPLDEEEEDRPKPPPRKKKGKNQQNVENEPYIPAPDYDERSTRKFNGGPTDAPRHEPIFEEFGGEDFSKYLSDEEDYEFDTSLTWRKEKNHKRYKGKNNGRGMGQRSKSGTLPQIRKPQDGPKPPQDVRPIGKKSQRPLDKVHENMKRNTIRQFTFDDSKMGNGTVRSTASTSAKGRYMKRNKERGRIVEANEEGSYEDFLRNRHNENGSNSSNDSGIGPGGDIDYHNHVFMNSQPKIKDGKSSLWKKLTWKFKRNTSGYQMS